MICTCKRTSPAFADLNAVEFCKGRYMTRADLVAAVSAENPDLSSQRIEILLSCFFELITDRLADGGRVELRGFGSFSTRARGASLGRNPRTGEIVNVDAKRVPFFRTAKNLRKTIADTEA